MRPESQAKWRRDNSRNPEANPCPFRLTYTRHGQGDLRAKSKEEKKAAGGLVYVFEKSSQPASQQRPSTVRCGGRATGAESRGAAQQGRCACTPHGLAGRRNGEARKGGRPALACNDGFQRSATDESVQKHHDSNTREEGEKRQSGRKRFQSRWGGRTMAMRHKGDGRVNAAARWAEATFADDPRLGNEALPGPGLSQPKLGSPRAGLLLGKAGWRLWRSTRCYSRWRTEKRVI